MPKGLRLIDRALGTTLADRIPATDRCELADAVIASDPRALINVACGCARCRGERMLWPPLPAPMRIFDSRVRS